MGAGITRREELLRLFPGILKWMRVRDLNGHTLGRVASTGDFEMVINKGFLFPQFYLLNYIEITGAFGNSLYVARGEAALSPLTLTRPRFYLLGRLGSHNETIQRKAA
jgi:hypothetical protein